MIFLATYLQVNFFDGGGHKNAAGGKFSGKLDEATSKFKDSIKKFNSKNKL